MIYTSNDINGHAVLRCEQCPEWEVDIDGAAVEEVVRRADDHKNEHATQQEETQ